MNANLKAMREEIKFGRVEMRSIGNAWIEDMKKDQKETMSCQVATAACLDSKELNPEDMESEVELREVPTKEATMKSSGPMKKWHGPASSCRVMQRAEETDPRRLWTLEEVSCHLQEGVLSCSSGMAQEMRLQGNCGPWKELTAASRRMTHSTKVTWRREHNRKRYDKDDVVQETLKGQTFRKRRWKSQECNSGIRDRGLSSYDSISE
jgi:hypothetical protein